MIHLFWVERRFALEQGAKREKKEIRRRETNCEVLCNIFVWKRIVTLGYKPGEECLY